MPDPQDYTQEILELLAALRSESITAAQAERIVFLLGESPEARRCFLLSQGIAAVIHRTLANFPAGRNLPAGILGEEGPGDFGLSSLAAESDAPKSGDAAGTQLPRLSATNPPIDHPTGPAWLPSSVSWVNQTLYHKPLILTFSLLFIGAIVISLWGASLFIISRVNAASAANSFVARLTGSENCQWAADSIPAQLGQVLGAGMDLKLLSGVAYLRYADGAWWL